MKRVIAGSAALMAAVLVVSQALAAQHQPGAPMHMGTQGQPGEQAGPGMGGPGMMPPMQHHMMQHMMMHHMMGGMMGPMGLMGPMGMMGMMGAEKDPKALGRMLQLRGEMLKAIGEVLLKHGKAMVEEAP